MPALSKFDALPARRRAGPSAFLTVQEGCDKFCTYCVVPYTRGAEISRPWDDVIAEAQALVDGGAREIVLLGQNVNAWGDGGRGLAELIRALSLIDGLERIRYTTSHPADMSDALIAAHGEVDKLMPYLHLPVQSGSDRILKAMNRSHSVESYLAHHREGARGAARHRHLRRLHRRLPRRNRGGFRSHAEHCRRSALCVGLYSFKYSPRPGTPAATMENQIPAEVMEERLQRLQSRLAEHSTAFNRSCIGRETRILIDRKGRKPGQMIGKSPWLQSVFVETGAEIGDWSTSRIDQALPNSLGGTLARQAVAA